MKRDWWYVIRISRWGYPFITISDDPALDWSTVIAEYEHYEHARCFIDWFAKMVDA